MTKAVAPSLMKKSVKGSIGKKKPSKPTPKKPLKPNMFTPKKNKAKK